MGVRQENRLNGSEIIRLFPIQETRRFRALVETAIHERRIRMVLQQSLAAGNGLRGSFKADFHRVDRSFSVALYKLRDRRALRLVKKKRPRVGPRGGWVGFGQVGQNRLTGNFQESTVTGARNADLNLFDRGKSFGTEEDIHLLA